VRDLHEKGPKFFGGGGFACGVHHPRMFFGRKGKSVNFGAQHKLVLSIKNPLDTKGGAQLAPRRAWFGGLLITESIKEVLPLLPNPCHFQDDDRSMLSPNQPGSEGCSRKICARGSGFGGAAALGGGGRYARWARAPRLSMLHSRA